MFLLWTLYFALISARLEYVMPCWGGTYKMLINNYQTLFLSIILKTNSKEKHLSTLSAVKHFTNPPLFHF